MRIVIVGATGNVGTAVLRRLHGVGHELVGAVRRPPDEGAAPYDGVDWHRVDVAQPEAALQLERAFAGADAVLHLAWLLQPNRREAVMRATNVDGTWQVLSAAARAGVPHVVVVSSVAAYSAGPKTTRVGEDWPTGGIHSSHYSRHKAATERLFDEFEARHPDVVLTRVRPGLVFQRDAATEVGRLFVGARRPRRWIGRLRPPVLPMPREVISQAVHADDLADALARIIELRAPGAFNIAGEPVLDPEQVRRVIGARTVVPVPRAVVRAAMWTGWVLGVQAADPGWLDIATNVPVMSTERARRDLGWTPQRRSTDALREMLDGVGDAAHLPASPPLARQGGRAAAAPRHRHRLGATAGRA
ncbi:MULTISPECIES: NAD-dependent epimerase/dehydratase family protein [unclassified Agromyces]|uniref:NAD-dependent epimerase/dehydratase family protein n=1 Tax=unclassified Agromyces TaxID=2639701 RepID=UPI00301464C0